MEKIKKIKTTQSYLITLNTGMRINGVFFSEGSKIRITGIQRTLGGVQNISILVQPSEIVLVRQIDPNFWSRFSANIDIHYSFTRSNNLRQYSSSSSITYRADLWNIKGSYNALNSRQDSIEPTDRTEVDISFTYLLQRDYYITSTANFLSNTEQSLDLRTTARGGLGKYILHTNQAYIGISAGIAFNNEVYDSDIEEGRQSLESFLGTELNLFDTGDLNFNLSATIFPSLTESRRIRADLSGNLKYDLPLDFYIKAWLSVNYDNRSVSGTNNLDYMVQTGFGWELN